MRCALWIAVAFVGCAPARTPNQSRVERSRHRMDDAALVDVRVRFAKAFVDRLAEAKEMSERPPPPCTDGPAVLGRTDALLAVDRAKDAEALVAICGDSPTPELRRAASRIALSERRFRDAVVAIGLAKSDPGTTHRRAMALEHAAAIAAAHDTPPDEELDAAVADGFRDDPTAEPLVRSIVRAALGIQPTALDERHEAELLAYIDDLVDREAAGRLLGMYTVVALGNEYRHHDVLRTWSTRLALLEALPAQSLLGLSASIEVALMNHPAEARGNAEARALLAATIPFQRRTVPPVRLGFSPYTYADLRKSVCQDAFEIGPRLRMLEAAYLEGKLSAPAALAQADGLRPSNGTATADLETFRGTLLDVLERDEEALDAFWAARQACPLYGRAIAGTLGTLARLTQAARPDALVPVVTRPLPASLGRYVTNFAILSERQKTVVAFTLAFWFPYLDHLKKAGGSGLYVQPTFQRISETPPYATRAKETASRRDPSDGRLFDDLGGSGGRSTTVTFAALEDYRWGVTVHETAHQFHELATRAVKTCIASLFACARARQRFAGGYASRNDHEYFAVGVQHYAMPEGYRGQGGISRGWYRANDPRLYTFLASIEASAGDMSRIVCPP